MRGRVMTRFEFDTMINYNLFQKLELLDNCEFDHLTIILTNLGDFNLNLILEVDWTKEVPHSPTFICNHLIVGRPFVWCRLGLTLFSLRVLTTKTEPKGKMRKVLRLSGGALRVLVHLRKWVLFVCLFVCFFFFFFFASTFKLCSGAE